MKGFVVLFLLSSSLVFINKVATKSLVSTFYIKIYVAIRLPNFISRKESTSQLNKIKSLQHIAVCISKYLTVAIRKTQFSKNVVYPAHLPTVIALGEQLSSVILNARLR